MTSLRLSPAAIVGLLAVAALPLLVRLVFPSSEKYYLHLLIQILIWSFIYTGWSLMGRFGLTSLGHGAFTGIGAYGTVLAVELRGPDALARHPDRRSWSQPSSACWSAIPASACASPATISRC